MRSEVLVGAACRSSGVELTGLFFSDDPGQVASAKSICAGCRVAQECLTGAIARGEPAGVWGGQEFKNGQVRRGSPGELDRAGLCSAPVRTTGADGRGGGALARRLAASS